MLKNKKLQIFRRNKFKFLAIALFCLSSTLSFANTGTAVRKMEQALYKVVPALVKPEQCDLSIEIIPNRQSQRAQLIVRVLSTPCQNSDFEKKVVTAFSSRHLRCEKLLHAGGIVTGFAGKKVDDIRLRCPLNIY